VVIIGSFREGVFGPYKEVLGLKVYSSLQNIPVKAILALLMINARNVPGVIRSCPKTGIKS